MAKSTARPFLLLLGLLLLVSITVRASDPDLTTDFDVVNPSVANFTFSGFRNLPQPGPGEVAPTFASFQNVPGLKGLGLTASFVQFAGLSQIDPHTHPRASEIFYVLSGELNAGFVDTNNELFETTLHTGDLFVFPKGLLHWLRNNDWGAATGFSALSSENPGFLGLARALFTGGSVGLPDNVLSTAFATSNEQIDILKKTVAARNA